MTKAVLCSTTKRAWDLSLGLEGVADRFVSLVLLHVFLVMTVKYCSSELAG